MYVCVYVCYVTRIWNIKKRKQHSRISFCVCLCACVCVRFGSLYCGVVYTTYINVPFHRPTNVRMNKPSYATSSAGYIRTIMHPANHGSGYVYTVRLCVCVCVFVWCWCLTNVLSRRSKCFILCMCEYNMDSLKLKLSHSSPWIDMVLCLHCLNSGANTQNIRVFVVYGDGGEQESLSCICTYYLTNWFYLAFIVIQRSIIIIRQTY